MGLVLDFGCFDCVVCVCDTVFTCYFVVFVGIYFVTIINDCYLFVNCLLGL